MQTYRITERAGDYVAGRRVAGLPVEDNGRRTLMLTDSEAAYELSLGSIEPDAQESLPLDGPASSRPRRPRQTRADEQMPASEGE